MLFNEPKLLKCCEKLRRAAQPRRFSALQRAEIAEIILKNVDVFIYSPCFSALQRAEIAEMQPRRLVVL